MTFSISKQYQRILGSGCRLGRFPLGCTPQRDLSMHQPTALLHLLQVGNWGTGDDWCHSKRREAPRTQESLSPAACPWVLGGKRILWQKIASIRRAQRWLECSSSVTGTTGWISAHSRIGWWSQLIRILRAGVKVLARLFWKATISPVGRKLFWESEKNTFLFNVRELEKQGVEFLLWHGGNWSD